MPIRILTYAFFLSISLIVSANDAPDAQSASPGDTIYIADLGATELRQTLALRVEASPQTVLPADIDFRCTIISPGEYDGIIIALVIERSNGPVLYEGGLALDLASGEQEVALRWPVDSDLPDGDYEIRITAERSNGTHMASTRLRLLKLSRALVSDSVDRASEALSALDDHVARLGEETFAPAALHKLEIAHETFEFAKEAWQDENWPVAYDRALEAIDSVAMVRAGLTFAALTPERFAESPAVAPNDVTIRDGAVVSASTPVFLYGVRLSLADAKHISEIGRFGMNAVVLEVSPADVLTGPDTVLDLERVLDPILDECGSLGIAVALQLQPQKMAGWALDQWPDMARSQFDPFYYDVTHPRALNMLEKFYGAVGAYIDQEPRIFAVSVADAPRFRISDEPMRKGFAVHLRKHYESDVALNLAWQTRLPSIDAIPIRWDWTKRAYQAHLQTYHRDQVTGFFSWIVNAFGPNDRGVPLTFTAPGSTFAIGSAKDGIDVELLNRTFAASGSESAPDGPPSGYAVSYPDAQMQICLTRSLNPAKPVFDLAAKVGVTDRGLAGGAEFPFRERARLWQSAMAGVDVNVVPFEMLFDAGEGRLSSHDPRDLAGFISGGETLNRLAGIVQRFQQQSAPVAILWSDSSRMLGDGSPHLPALRRAYEGASFYGLPLRFISERQLAAGELDSVTILIIPEVSAMKDDAFEALERYVAGGGRLVSTGSSIPYNAYGGSRPLRLQASPLTKLVRGAENADNYLRALDAAVEASGLEEIPRAVDDLGYPIPGVVSRFLENEEGRYLYLVNLNAEARSIRLPVGRLEGRDLIDGRDVRFPLEIAPLDPMLIALAPLDAADAADDSTDVSSSGVPTAIVERVLEDGADR